MPCGIPVVWQKNLECVELDSLFGFLEIVCPTNISRPFLSSKENSALSFIFPTGQFIGVFSSEELI